MYDCLPDYDYKTRERSSGLLPEGIHYTVASSPKLVSAERYKNEEKNVN